MELTTHIGPLPFKLASVRTGHFEVRDAAPLLQLEDGAILRRWTRDGQTYLVMDHRSHPEALARIEFWDCSGPGPEGELAGLFALCDGARASSPQSS